MKTAVTGMGSREPNGWDQFFGLNHAQLFAGLGTAPNFVLSNLSASASTPAPADGIELLARSVCGGSATLNVRTLLDGAQVDYLAIALSGGGSEQLTSMRLFDQLQLTGAAQGSAMCNLAFDDLTLVRTHLFIDDFEAAAVNLPACTQMAAGPSWASEREGCSSE